MKMMLISALMFVVSSAFCFGLGGAAKPGYCLKEVLRPKKVFIDGAFVDKYMPAMVEICCPGYTSLRQQCVPLCEELCVNSHCTAPNTCSCKDGYKRLSASRCEPACENCERGFCLAPGECECFLGHKKDSTTGKCVPMCNLPCINGYCTDPNVCTCDIGYHVSEKNAHTCIPSANQETTYTVEETAKDWEEMTSTMTSGGGEMMVSSGSATVETATETERNDYTAVFTEDEEYPGYNDTSYDEDVMDKRLSQVTDSSTEKFESTSENTSDQTTTTDAITQLISLSTLQSETTFPSTQLTIDSTVRDEIEFLTKQGVTYSTERSSAIIARKTNSAEMPADSLQSSNLIYILLGAVLIILVISLMVLHLMKHSKKTTYNIAEMEKTKGVAKYSSKKDDVIASWESV